MGDNGNLAINFEVQTSDGVKNIEIGSLGVVPRIGELIECNYVHGTKIKFEVSEVRHFLYNSGHSIMQHIVIRGEEIFYAPNQ